MAFTLVTVTATSIGPKFLTEAVSSPSGVTRVIAASVPQLWRKTEIDGGGFTLHHGTGPHKIYLTAERESHRAHVVLEPKNGNFKRQVWRNDILVGHIALGRGTSLENRLWLQADQTLSCGGQFVVELINDGSLGQGSEWSID